MANGFWAANDTGRYMIKDDKLLWAEDLPRWEVFMDDEWLCMRIIMVSKCLWSANYSGGK